MSARRTRHLKQYQNLHETATYHDCRDRIGKSSNLNRHPRYIIFDLGNRPLYGGSEAGGEQRECENQARELDHVLLIGVGCPNTFYASSNDRHHRRFLHQGAGDEVSR